MAALPASHPPAYGRERPVSAPFLAPITPWLVLTAFLGLAGAVFMRVWQAPLASVAGSDASDPGIIVWCLGWVPFAVSHLQNPLLSNFLDWPSGVNLMWNAEMPLAGLLLWPLTAAFGPLLSYNVLVTLAPALSAWAGFLAIRRYVANPAAAALGGLLYGFSPYMITQSQGHLHVTLAFIPPIMLLVLDELLVRQAQPAVRTGILLGLLAVAQLLLGEELLTSEALITVLGIVLLGSLYPERVRAHRRHALIGLGAAGAVFVALAAAPVAMQFLGPQHVVGAVQIRNEYVSDLLGFVVPTEQLLFAPPAAQAITQHFSGYPAEWDAYLGLPLLSLLVFTAVRFWRLPEVRFASTLALLIAVLSLGPTLHVAGRSTVIPLGALVICAPLLRRVIPYPVVLYAFPAAWVGLAVAPVLSNLLPARLMLYVFLFAGLLLAVGAAAMLRPARTSLPAWVLIGVSVLALTPRFPVAAQPVAIPSFFTGAGVRSIPEGSVTLVLPYARLVNSRAMFWQSAAGMRFRMPEGYALLPGPHFSPPPTATGNALAAIESDGEAPAVTDALRSQVVADLSAWQVQTIIVGPMSHQDRAVAFLTAVLGRAPDQRDGVLLWRL